MCVPCVGPMFIFSVSSSSSSAHHSQVLDISLSNCSPFCSMFGYSHLQCLIYFYTKLYRIRFSSLGVITEQTNIYNIVVWINVFLIKHQITLSHLTLCRKTYKVDLILLRPMYEYVRKYVIDRT
jgi:hypothetical protein